MDHCYTAVIRNLTSALWSSNNLGSPVCSRRHPSPAALSLLLPEHAAMWWDAKYGWVCCFLSQFLEICVEHRAPGALWQPIFSWIFCSMFNYSVCWRWQWQAEREGSETDAGEQPLVYCKSHVMDILVAEVGARKVQVRGQGTWLGWRSSTKYTSFCLTCSSGSLSPVLVDALGSAELLRATRVLTAWLNLKAEMTGAIYVNKDS